MRLQPIQQLLDIWQAVCQSAYTNDVWHWNPPERADSNTDAEQLLCILLPAANIWNLKVDRSTETAEYVLDALHTLGDAVEIPRRLTTIIGEYLDRYTDAGGTPVFSADTSLIAVGADSPAVAQRSAPLVCAFTSAITMCLAALGFLRVFRGSVRREDLRIEIDRLDQLLGNRLGAAMIGLLRSFAVNIIDIRSEPGQRLYRTVKQAGQPPEELRHGLRRALLEVRAAMQGIMIGSGDLAGLDDEQKLFECGWSWGIIDGAPTIETHGVDWGRQPAGVAVSRPDLYCTVRALDAIEELFSERTRILGLLGEEQQRLSRALQLRWNVTYVYWSTVAMFGPEQWPLEDLPWQTTDGRESDYFSALLTALVTRGLRRYQLPEAKLARLGDVLYELASRGRVTRRAAPDDPALTLQSRGLSLPLPGSEQLGPALTIRTNDYSPLLLSSAVLIGAQCRTAAQRTRLTVLADRIWQHLAQRRLEHADLPTLWDRPGAVYPHLVPSSSAGLSWHYTTRVMESLVMAANATMSSPAPSDLLSRIANDLLDEAETWLDHELVFAPAGRDGTGRQDLQTWVAQLRRARELVADRPGAALTLASDVLRGLARLRPEN